MFFRTYSPQGDGNYQIRYHYPYQIRYHYPCFSEPIPRKGTETTRTAILNYD